MVIEITESALITRHPDLWEKPITTHALLPDLKFEANGIIFKFDTHWNRCRHFLGIMNCINPKARIIDRLN